MGFFDDLKRAFAKDNTPHIPREIFVQDIDDDEEEQDIEGTEPVSGVPPTGDNGKETTELKTIQTMENNYAPLQGKEEIENFFSKDFGPDGYKDALVTPDTSYLEMKKQMLKIELEVIIERALKYYNDKLSEFDFHIKTRTQSGLMDTVDEVESEKRKVLDEIENIKAILADAQDNKGKGQIVVLSYERGFKRGLAAITSATLFGKKNDNE